MKEFPGGSTLLAAGVQNRPNACIPLSAHRGTAAMRDPAVDDQLPHTLFTTIVGRRNRGVEQESEDCIAMFAQAFGQRRRLGWQVLLFGQSQHSFFNLQHTAVKLIFGNLVALMPKAKQIFKLAQQGLSKGLIVLVWQRREEFDVANQMCQTKLLKLVGIFDIGTKKIAHNCAVVGFSQDFLENFG